MKDNLYLEAYIILRSPLCEETLLLTTDLWSIISGPARVVPSLLHLAAAGRDQGVA